MDPSSIVRNATSTAMSAVLVHAIQAAKRHTTQEEGEAADADPGMDEEKEEAKEEGSEGRKRSWLGIRGKRKKSVEHVEHPPKPKKKRQIELFFTWREMTIENALTVRR